MKREILNSDELHAALNDLNGWTVEDKLLKKHLKFDNFAAALSFVNQVGALRRSRRPSPGHHIRLGLR